MPDPRDPDEPMIEHTVPKDATRATGMIRHHLANLPGMAGIVVQVKQADGSYTYAKVTHVGTSTKDGAGMLVLRVEE